VGLLFLLVTSHALEEHGGLTISILSGLALWQAFRFNQFSRKPNILFAVNTLAIAAISSCYTAIIWFRQISEQNDIGGTSLQSGLLAVFLGSLIMLALLIWSHLSNHQSEIHQQSP
jgi:hypothetical protein